MKSKLFAAFAALLLSSQAQAAEVIDQDNLAPAGFYPGSQIFGAAEAGQIFTVGTTGLLSRVDLLIGGVANQTVDFWIRPVQNGVVDPNNTNALARFSIVSPLWGTPFYPVSTLNVAPAGINVVSGQQYAITLSSLNNIFSGWAGPDPTPYFGGNAIQRVGSTSAWQQINSDLIFRTYVDTSPVTSAVPEPASWLLMILGFGFVGLSMRRGNILHSKGTSVSNKSFPTGKATHSHTAVPA